MRKWYVLFAALACAAAGTNVALASGHSATGGAVVKAFGGEKVVVNKFLADEMHFSPGTVTVKSGSTLTFQYGDKEQEPHTITILSKSDLPKTPKQVENCAACQKYASPHLKNPKAEPGPANPIVHWVLNKGADGLDTVGDSVAIFSQSGHKKVSVKVTAPAGTTLYFVCAVHPWMQGKIVVK
jgi:plastocyanin